MGNINNQPDLNITPTKPINQKKLKKFFWSLIILFGIWFIIKIIRELFGINIPNFDGVKPYN